MKPSYTDTKNFVIGQLNRYVQKTPTLMKVTHNEFHSMEAAVDVLTAFYNPHLEVIDTVYGTTKLYNVFARLKWSHGDRPSTDIDCVKVRKDVAEMLYYLWNYMQTDEPGN